MPRIEDEAEGIRNERRARRMVGVDGRDVEVLGVYPEIPQGIFLDAQGAGSVWKCWVAVGVDEPGILSPALSKGEGGVAGRSVSLMTAVEPAHLACVPRIEDEAEGIRNGRRARRMVGVGGRGGGAGCLP